MTRQTPTLSFISRRSFLWQMFAVPAAVILAMCRGGVGNEEADMKITGRSTIASTIASAAQPEANLSELLLTADDFMPEAGGTSEGTLVSGNGMSLDPTAFKSTFLSPPILAPAAFNALVPQWDAELPGASSITLLLRTAITEGVWSNWTEIHVQADWMQPNDIEQVGQMIVVPGADATHQYVQYMVTFTRDNSLFMPVLRSLRLIFIDSTAGPTTAELIARQQQLDVQNGVQPQAPGDQYPRPFVISREAWCTHSACDYSDGLEYQPVTHLIVHHTVSNNNSADWAAVVRAIWNFHTFSRGWGDIGYNYLVDMDGVIYEGHNGGDDVIGTHASGANAGSMGVALIGTFTAPDYGIPGVTPPEPMVESLVELLAWKADQRSINVFDASDALPNIDWGLPHLMGHRDVYGTTECPGDQAHALIPFIRDRVAERISLIDPHVYVDEFSPQFTRSTGNWSEGPNGCGHNTHSYYAWSTTNAADSRYWGEWRPAVPVGGRYRIEAYIPYCNTGRSETRGAKYTVTHAEGTSEVVVSHSATLGLWASLGEYNLAAGSNTVIRLTDLTTTDSGLGVWFDAIRLFPLQTAPGVTTTQPAAESWVQQGNVNFQWTVTNPDSVQITSLEVATDPNISNRIVARSWLGAVEKANHTFSQDYTDLYWRVNLQTQGGEVIVGNVSHFGLDATPPVSAVQEIAFLESEGKYRLQWGGNDNTSGIAHYRVEWRAAGSSSWTTLVADTQDTAARFLPPDLQQTYEFRSQATDRAGNVEPAHATPDTSTSQARRLSNTTVLPLITGTPRR